MVIIITKPSNIQINSNIIKNCKNNNTTLKIIRIIQRKSSSISSHSVTPTDNNQIGKLNDQQMKYRCKVRDQNPQYWYVNT